MRQEASLFASGLAGSSVAADTTVALINAPGPGVYKIWGHCRHSLADGLKLTSPNLTPLILSGGAGQTILFGPVVMAINNLTSGIIIALNTATGASDTASATIYAEKLSR